MLQAATAAAAWGGIQSKRTEQQQPNRSSFPAREHMAQDAASPTEAGEGTEHHLSLSRGSLQDPQRGG